MSVEIDPPAKPHTWGRSHAMRLPGDNRGPGLVAVTIVTDQRAQRLTPHRDIAGSLDLDLGSSSLDQHAQVLVACFMPDHVHLLLQLDGQGKPLWEYIRIWKLCVDKATRSGGRVPVLAADVLRPLDAPWRGP